MQIAVRTTHTHKSGDEGDQHVAQGQDAETGEIVVLVKVAKPGNQAKTHRDFVAVHPLPCFEDFIHGGRGVIYPINPRSCKVLVSKGGLLKHPAKHQDLVPTDGNDRN